MTYKERKAKKTALFSLSAYLKKKALHKAELLTYRAAKREGTLPQEEVKAEEHVHSHECDHEHVHIDEEQA